MHSQQYPIGLLSVIQQLTIMLSDLKDGMYDQPLDVLNGATLGKHIRHIHDFYQAIVVGVENGTIDYNSRQRNEEIERSAVLALGQLHHWQKALAEIEKEKEVWVCPSIGYGSQCNQIRSSVEREMMYAYDHAIHHLALIKIGFESVHDHKLPADFGVAPSTLQHHQKP